MTRNTAETCSILGGHLHTSEGQDGETRGNRLRGANTGEVVWPKEKDACCYRFHKVEFLEAVTWPEGTPHTRPATELQVRDTVLSANVPLSQVMGEPQ